MRYNYDTGKVEPEDLTGADLRFSIYKPGHTLDIEATQYSTGQNVSRSVTITGEEFEKMQALDTEEAKAAYLWSLPKVRAAHGAVVEEIKGLEQGAHA
jgi:hypothetical protein